MNDFLISTDNLRLSAKMQYDDFYQCWSVYVSTGGRTRSHQFPPRMPFDDADHMRKEFLKIVARELIEELEGMQ